VSKRKDITIKAPTLEIEAKVLPPEIITIKRFLRISWKYIIATWTIIIMVAYVSSALGNHLPWQLAPIPGILLSIIPFLVGIRAITLHTIEEISH
jgi:hypothetical protein